MKMNGRVVGALLLSVAAGCGDGTQHNPGDGGPGDGLPAAPACAWNMRPPELSLPTAEVKGVLRGASRNASTTCTRQKGTGGPEAIYLLRVPERALVELEVTSTIDTVIAIRRVCDDPLTELACNDSPLGSSPILDGGVRDARPVDATQPRDAGAARSGGATAARVDAGAADGATLAQVVLPDSGRDAHLRAVLEPGYYYVLLDEAEPFGVGGEFQLKLTSGPAPGQSSCATAHVLQDGTSLPAEELDLGTELAPSCTGGEKRPALYYRATIPSGQRLTARAFPLRGDRSWTPVLQLLSACSEGLCLATDRASPDGQQMLRYVNNGPTDQQVVLSVGASNVVSNAAFRLDVGIGVPLDNGTCAAARPVSDGLILRNQDLSEGQIGSGSFCKPGDSPSLFYSASLLEGQTIRMTTLQNGGPPQFPVVLLLRQGCNDTNCSGLSDRVDYTNPGPGTRTAIVEVTTFPGAPLLPFDLHVSISLPPGRILVNAAPGLQTSEAGGQATFEVVLGSPPSGAVVLPLSSSNPAEGAVSPAQLTFDTANWMTPQTVTVTGVDDSNQDGARAYQVQVGPAQGGDARYTSLPATAVSLLNRDDEPGFYIVARTPLSTSESGGKATFTVVLNRAPTATVRLPLQSSDAGEGTVAPPELVFEPNSWNQAQMVTVTGVDDADEDGAQMYDIAAGPAASDDPQYAGIDPPDLAARNSDNDFERVAAQVVSGGLSCQQFGAAVPGLGGRIAMDVQGNLHALMICNQPSGGVWPDAGAASAVRDGSAGVRESAPSRDSVQGPNVYIATSLDGGRTFRAPVDMQVVAYEGQIAAADEAVVVVSAGIWGVAVSRSEDGGGTWQPPLVLNPSGGNVRLAAAGAFVAVAADTSSGPTLWFSQDNGKTFKQSAAPGGRMGPSVSLGIDRGTGHLWLVGYEGQMVLRISRDGGASFDSPVTIDTEYAHTIALSPTTIFAAGKERLRVQTRELTGQREVFGLSPSPAFPPVLVTDDRDNLVVLDTSVEGAVLLRRLAAGATELEAGKSVGSTGMPPSGVALSETAVAVALYSGGQVRVAVETWP